MAGKLFFVGGVFFKYDPQTGDSIEGEFGAPVSGPNFSAVVPESQLSQAAARINAALAQSGYLNAAVLIGELTGKVVPPKVDIAPL